MQRLGRLDLKALIFFRVLASSSINCANLIELNQLVPFMRFFVFFITSPPSIIDDVTNKEYNIKLSLCFNSAIIDDFREPFLKTCERFWWSQCPHLFPTGNGNRTYLCTNQNVS